MGVNRNAGYFGPGPIRTGIAGGRHKDEGKQCKGYFLTFSSTNPKAVTYQEALALGGEEGTRHLLLVHKMSQTR